jgi:hypothetical protein
MKKIIGVIFAIFTSCTITKSLPIRYKTTNELSEFYKENNIENYLIVNSYKSLVELYNQDKVSIPKNIIFDSDGFEIKHFNDKLCANQTLEFLKSYDENTKINKSDFNISDYLKYFKIVNNNLEFNKILNSKKIRVFVNTATYANKYKANEEAFEIYKQFKEKYEVYIVNLDYINEWEDKQ